MRPQPTTNRDAALDFLDRGYAVFPIRARSKQPLVKWARYQQELPTVARVRTWWQRWPDASIAVVTGEISRLLILDRDGDSWPDEVLELLDQHPTLRARTGGGGEHIYYRLPQLTELGRHIKLWDGVDVLGGRGYALAPPSSHPSGGRYAWLDGEDLDDVARVPTELLELIDEACEDETPTATSSRPTRARRSKLPPASKSKREAFRDLWAELGIKIDPTGERHYSSPWSSDSTPSCNINADACVWYCHSTGKGGGLGRLRDLVEEAFPIVIADEPREEPQPVRVEPPQLCDSCSPSCACPSYHPPTEGVPYVDMDKPPLTLAERRLERLRFYEPDVSEVDKMTCGVTVLLRDKADHRKHMVFRPRCGHWNCRSCAPRLKLAWEDHLLKVAEGPLWLLRVEGDKACNAAKRKIKRAGGEYARFRMTEELEDELDEDEVEHSYALLTNVELEGAQLIDEEEREHELAYLMLSVPMRRKRPISTSRGWKFPPKEQEEKEEGEGWELIDSTGDTPEQLRQRLKQMRLKPSRVAKIEDARGGSAHFLTFEVSEGTAHHPDRYRRLVCHLVSAPYEMRDGRIWFPPAEAA